MLHRTVTCVLLAAAVVLPGAVLAKEATTPATQPAQPAAVFTNDTIDKVNTQPGSIQPTRDVATGQSSGYREGGVNDATVRDASAQPGQFIGGAGGDGTGIRRDQPAQGGNALVNNENVTGARGTATAKPGAGPSQTCISECNNVIDLVRATPQDGAKATAAGGQIARPARSGQRQRKARRMHKP